MPHIAEIDCFSPVPSGPCDDVTIRCPMSNFVPPSFFIAKWVGCAHKQIRPPQLFITPIYPSSWLEGGNASTCNEGYGARAVARGWCRSGMISIWILPEIYHVFFVSISCRTCALCLVLVALGRWLMADARRIPVL